MDIKEYSNYHREFDFGIGKLNVFANDTIFGGIEGKVYSNAYHNLLIPNNHFFSYTPDVHPSKGTCVGTTAIWNMKNGYVSPSIVGVDIGCGMRMHLTNLHKDDLKGTTIKRKIISSVETYIPTKARVHSGYDNIWLENIVKDGLYGLPKQYVPDQYTPNKRKSFTHVEHAKFEFDKSYLDGISSHIWSEAHGQLGTLGNGNHFIEFQSISIDEKNRDIAKKWGLFDGQVVYMIHSGSRAWGGKLGAQYLKKFRTYMNEHGMKNPEPQLVYAPIDSNVGQMYMHLMYSALNYAVANRHLMAFGVKQALTDVFGRDVQTEVLYDLMHNYALEEEHNGERYLVHRKGATRSLPKEHALVPNSYKDTGHPALIPGSMGTSSYIMLGQQEGKKNYHSICHGAGRVFSRTEAKEQISIDSFEKSMKIGTEDEIVVNHVALESILDEAPQAYKDVDQIIESIEGANLSSVVAKCSPMIVIKGM